MSGTARRWIVGRLSDICPRKVAVFSAFKLPVVNTLFDTPSPKCECCPRASLLESRSSPAALWRLELLGYYRFDDPSAAEAVKAAAVSNGWFFYRQGRITGPRSPYTIELPIRVTQANRRRATPFPPSSTECSYSIATLRSVLKSVNILPVPRTTLAKGFSAIDTGSPVSCRIR